MANEEKYEKVPCEFCGKMFDPRGIDNHRESCLSKTEAGGQQIPMTATILQRREDKEREQEDEKFDREREKMDRRKRKAKLKSRLKRVKRTIRQMPEDMEEDVDEMTEVISEYLDILKKRDVSAVELDEIEESLEDEIEIDFKEMQDDAKTYPNKKTVGQIKKSGDEGEYDEVMKLLGGGTGDLKSEALNLQFEMRRMEMENRRMDMQRKQIEMQMLMKKLNGEESVKPTNEQEIKARTLPDGSVVEMTDRQYADWILQYEGIQARKKEQKESMSEFPLATPQGIKILNVPREQLHMYQQMYGPKDNDSKDEMKMLIQEQNRQINEMRESQIRKELDQLKGQMSYDPQEEFWHKLDRMQERFPQAFNPSERNVQTILAEGQKDFQNATLNILDKRLDGTDRKLDRVLDFYLESQIEVAKDKARKKAEAKGQEVTQPQQIAQPQGYDMVRRDIESRFNNSSKREQRRKIAEEIVAQEPDDGFQVMGGNARQDDGYEQE